MRKNEILNRRICQKNIKDKTEKYGRYTTKEISKKEPKKYQRYAREISKMPLGFKV